eukprot:356858-Chlamydomonas_euryale.AAC.2
MADTHLIQCRFRLHDKCLTMTVQGKFTYTVDGYTFNFLTCDGFSKCLYPVPCLPLSSRHTWHGRVRARPAVVLAAERSIPPTRRLAFQSSPGMFPR